MSFLFAALLAFAAPAQATAQVPDVILIDGERHPLLASPMEGSGFSVLFRPA